MENQELNYGDRLTPEERQERVKRLKRKRRVRKAIVVTAFVVIACVILSPILLFGVFRIKDFAIEGETLYSKEQIVEASGISYGKSIFFADLDEAKVNIEKALPYTNNVKFARRLPNTLVITLESTDKAYAVEKSEGLYAIVNRDFKVLEISGILPDGVVPVIGATPEATEIGMTMSFVEEDEQSDVTLKLIQSISSAVAESNLKDINLVSVRSRSNIYLIYQERIVLRLGDSSDIDKKIVLGQKVIAEEDSIDAEKTGIINLTVPKKAYFNPSDIKDIPELTEYKKYITVNDKDSIEEAYAVECKNGSYAITNPAFVVLDFSQTAPEGIVPIGGYLPETAKTGETLSYGTKVQTDICFDVIRSLTEAVDESGISNVNLIGFDAENNVYLICDERIVLRIGTMNNIENKLSAGKKMIAEEAEDAVGIIELNDLEKAEFDEKKYQDINELMKYKPVEEETTED